MKVLFRQYTSYGKGDNECLYCQWVEEDTPESRREAIEDKNCVDCEEDAGLEFDEDGCTVSCKYCRNEAVSEDDMLYYLLDKLQITKENLEKEIIETRKKETK